MTNTHAYAPRRGDIARFFDREANMISQRIKRHKEKGKPTTSDQIWGWIKERHPKWSEADQERLFQKVRS